MFEAVKKWVPLYLSGSIEPYYYPRIRDGVFMRTMFIARGHSAIISQSTAGQSESVLNIYLEEESAVKAMESEFDAFLRRCKPLMRTMKALEKTKLEELLSSFEEVPGDARIIRVDAASAAVCLKQSAALVLGLKNPYSAFVINEPRMIAAMTEYIDNLPIDSVSIKDIRDIVD